VLLTGKEQLTRENKIKTYEVLFRTILQSTEGPKKLLAVVVPPKRKKKKKKKGLGGKGKKDSKSVVGRRSRPVEDVGTRRETFEAAKRAAGVKEGIREKEKTKKVKEGGGN